MTALGEYSELRRTHRRHFMRMAAGGISAAAVGTISGKSGLAIEPIHQDKPPHFKFSLAAYSYRNLLKGEGAELTLFDFVDDCADFGLEGTELTSYYFAQPLTTSYLRQLKRHCFRRGLEVSGTAVGNDFGHPPGESRDQELASMKRWIEYAEVLGAPVIRVFAGHQKEGISSEETHKLMVDGLQQSCEYAEMHGVHLALENHGGPTSTSEGLLALVRDIDSDWFGVNLDTGNFHSDDVYSELAAVAPYALNVQVKVAVSGPDRKAHAADYGRIAQLLRDAKYRGYVVLEYEEGGDPREQSRIHLGRIREAFGQ